MATLTQTEIRIENYLGKKWDRALSLPPIGADYAFYQIGQDIDSALRFIENQIGDEWNELHNDLCFLQDIANAHISAF